GPAAAPIVPPAAPASRWRRALWTFGSGPDVARLFGMLLAIVSLIAWLSLGVQVRRLVGARGLLPLADFVAAARDAGVARFRDLPTIFLWTQSDGALVAGVVAGVALSLAALVGLRRRLCFALIGALYLSYAAAARTFLSFQWDNLLLESCLLAVFLPQARRAPVAHFLFRVLLFKLYFESGLAKWQSPLRDWQDGSAMTFYYETAPLPTALAFYAHHLPVWWHHLESRATLVLELLLPFAIFGPRRARLGAAVAFTGFQVVNALTANYGFFCYLAAALHVFLLDDGDVARWRRFLLPRAAAPAEAAARDATDARDLADARAIDRAAAAAGVAVYLGLSLAEGAFAFGGGDEPGPVLTALAPVVDRAEALRLVNTYHLFASITRERVEPELQTLGDGDEADDAAWTAHDLRHKPGAPRRAPDFVAPHQPRLDFQLWFHGLAFRRGQPPYVHMLLERMCEDADAVRPFFRDPLPARPRAVRVVYWRYHFATRAEKRATGAWWTRERLAATSPVRCPVTP
ncbi:MAG TPA: lipase maturation factor family protein, partial [Polyangia bacterium]|nr:lipase maturation factor family protein [Polyangia bacterium]